MFMASVAHCAPFGRERRRLSGVGVIHQRFLHPSRAVRCLCPLAADPFYRSGTLEGAHPLITILASIQLFYTLYCDNKLIRSVS